MCWLYCIILFLCANIVYTANAQVNNDSVVARALIVGSVLPQERVYLHFDNNSYYLGDTVWFKAFVTSHNDDRPTKHSHVLYVELVAPEGYIVKTEKYKIENGSCEGSITLDPAYLSGYYEIRAYTRYMINWGKDAIFSRVFPVFDGVNEANWHIHNMCNRSRNSNRNDYKQKKKVCNLIFYPESGHLVYDIETRVAYELTDSNGKELDYEIIILADNKEIAKTSPSHRGKGSFKFIPRPGIEYKALVNVPNDKKRNIFNLPIIENNGVVINVTESKDSCCFVINNNYSSYTELAFIIQHRSSLGFYKNILGNKDKFAIAKEELPEGVNRAIVFNGRTPLAERLFFVEHDSILPFDHQSARLKVSVNNKKTSIIHPKPYEKITIVAEREDGNPINDETEFAISITDVAGSTQTSWNYNIYSYLLLGSEIKGYIPDAGQYFDHSNVNRKNHLDLVMLTNGWTAYDWEKLTAENMNDIVIAEKGISIRGGFYRKVRKTKFGKADEYQLYKEAYNQLRLDYMTPYNNLRNKNFNDKYVSCASIVRTDQLGKFNITFNDYYGNRVIGLSPKIIFRQNDNIRYYFLIDRYFSPKPRSYNYYEYSLHSETEQERSRLNEEMVRLGPNKYLIPEVEINEQRETHLLAPPVSELHLDYLDEWEYCYDATFLTTSSNDAKTKRALRQELNRAIETMMIRNGNLKINEDSIEMTYLEKDFRERFMEHRDVMTATDVLNSAIKRHSLPLGGWYMPIVVKGDYPKDSALVIDEKYLHGIDAQKMTSFKKIIITSDEKKCKVIKNGDGIGFWKSKSRALDNKGQYRIFYSAFLSDEVGNPNIAEWGNIANADSLMKLYDRGILHKKTKAASPDYLMCCVPYQDNDTLYNLIPDLCNSFGVRRYTSLQGYSKSKQFYSPNYKNAIPSEKDYRRTLFWGTQIKPTNGKLIFELYNSSLCSNIDIKIEGRERNILYSNDKNIYTRINNYTNDKRVEIAKQEFQEEEEYDSVFWAQCKEEFETAEMYYRQKKYSKSINIYAELSQYKYPPAIYRVGCSYQNGNGIAKNEHLATLFFEKGAEIGDAPSQYELAMIQLNSSTTEEYNPQNAIFLLEKSATQGYAPAQAELGKCYLNGIGTETDSIAASIMIHNAALQNNSNALFLYGKLMQKYNIKSDSILGTALNCIEKAANQEHIDALIYMMRYYNSIADYPNAYNAAFTLHQKRIEEGTLYCAYCYLHGKGVRTNKRLAKDLYQDAARKGNKEAEKILEMW